MNILQLVFKGNAIKVTYTIGNQQQPEPRGGKLFSDYIFFTAEEKKHEVKKVKQM